MHPIFSKLAYAVSLLMVGWACFALSGLWFPPVFRWRAARMRWPFLDPSLLALIWFCCFEVSRGDYFSALWYGILFGWMMRPSKTIGVLRRSQLAAEAVLSGAVGTIGILLCFGLLQRVLGPLGLFMLKPGVLLSASFAILLLLVWTSFHAAQSAQTPKAHC